MTGPGSLAVENHDDLASRLAALCEHQGFSHQRRVQVGKTPYGMPFKVDLLLDGLSAYPKGLAVIGRWQEGSGTADQKLPFLLLCIARARVDSVIVLDGDGWSEGVWEYMRMRRGGYFRDVLTIGEFAELLSVARGVA